MSYDAISKRYPFWAEADQAYDVWVRPEQTDFREKAVVTDTRAIADTVVTYMMSALAGRNPMFQLEGLNRHSRKASSILERVLHQQMRRTAGEARVAQLLLDSVRYGFSPTKVVFEGDKNSNDIRNYDPRRCFPDPRAHWSDLERMQFVGFTDFLTHSYLQHRDRYPRLSGDLQNVFAHSGTVKRGWDAHNYLREEGRGYIVNQNEVQAANTSGSSFFTLGDAQVVDEFWVSLRGEQLNLPGVGEIWLSITVLDEQHIIEFRLNPYGRQIPSVLGSAYFDQHKTYSQGVMDVLMPLHDIATWLMRSRVDNVQAALNNLIFADPTAVSIPDLIDRNPWGVVRTLPGTKPGDGVFVAEVPDVTRGHWNDIAALSDMKQRASAASDAQQGMPTPDVRTATEIQRLTQLGSQRLGVMSRVASATTIRPMVRMMVQNIQDSLTPEGTVKLAKKDAPGILRDAVQDDYLDYNISDLQGDIDYLVIDGTLPLEPTRNAETWINMLQMMDQTGLLMEYDGGRIAEEAIRAMGVSDLDQFKVPQEQSQQLSPSQQLMLMEKMRGSAAVQPAEQVSREAEKGNLVPARQANG